MSMMSSVGARFRHERQRRGMTQDEMAHRANTNQSMVSLVERGHRAPTVGTLLNLASALNCLLFIDLVPKSNIEGARHAQEQVSR